MKISAVRKNITNNNLSDNNNTINNKISSTDKQKHKKKRKMSSYSSSCCSLCSPTDFEDSVDIKITKNKKKVKLKKKKDKDLKKHSLEFHDKEKIFKNKKNESKTDFVVHCTDKSHLQLSDALNSGCISSSDNELPELVNEAIRRVNANASESDTDNNTFPPQQQYTSSLLQDFMEKTQMLGSSFREEIGESKSSQSSPLVCCKRDNSDEKLAQDSSTISRKKRGRPKRTNNSVPTNLPISSDNVSYSSPNLIKALNADETSKFSTISKPDSQSDSLTSSILATPKPKLDISELDKQIYANERTLYPPRNKKKASQNKQTKSQKKAHENLDPIWRKIDANSKFRRPSLSGYKSDGGSTVCSKVLAAKGGYVSDCANYCSRNYSGYKSDVSCKSHYSSKTCASRAKSCDYRCSRKMRKIHRKRKYLNINLSNKHAKSMSNINDQDILQLAGLTLGQSSEGSSRESVCKRPIDSSKKYGEINRFVRTGEYYCSSRNLDGSRTPNITSAFSEIVNETDSNYDIFNTKINESTSKLNDTLYNDDKQELDLFPRYVRSRRSSGVSIRSSCYSGYSRCKKYRKRRNKYFNKSSNIVIDPKLSAEIEILIESFPKSCHIHCDKSSKDSKESKEFKEKPIKHNKLDEKSEKNLHSKSLFKKNIKKRKISENIETHHNSATLIKRRHKKAISSSPDEHKLPLKKRHYLLASREKTDGKNLQPDFENNNKDTIISANNNVKINVEALPTKTRHLLDANSNKTKEDSSGRYVDHEKNLLKSVENKDEAINKSIHIKNNNNIVDPCNSKKKLKTESLVQKSKDKIESKTYNYPPPGVFEPTIDLEIQIPATKIHVNSIMEKSDIDSPLNKNLYDLHKTKECVVEKLLNKTGADLLLKRRKRKKINRTGFPTVRKKKILNKNFQNDENIEILDFNPDEHEKSLLESHLPKEKEKIEKEPKKKKKIAKLENIKKTIEKLEKKKLKKESKLFKNNITEQNFTLQPISQKPKGKPRGRKPKILTVSMETESKNNDGTEKKVKAKNKRSKESIDNTTSNSSKQKKVDISKKSNESKLQTKTKTNEEKCKEYLEHEPLPIKKNQDLSDNESAAESESQSNSSLRKGKSLKKAYLVAGLFSDYFKTTKSRKNSIMGKLNENSEAEQEFETENNNLLPPPPYCEKFFRRSIQDFYLPHDIWLEYKNSKLSKRVSVPSWNYRKIRTNIYASDVVRPLNTDHQSCNCKMESACGDDCLNRMVYTECFPSTCPCKDKCHNQKIQRHDVAPGTERFMTANKGWGVRTNLPIKKGTYIMEYVGEVVTEKEFKERMATLYINDTHHYCLHLDGGLVIDGHRMGSDGRFVNHSCSPNCEMQKWSVNGLPRMALFASRNIESGEELTYDYNFSLFNPSEGQPCRCETPQCRGVIGGKSQRIKIEQKSLEMQPVLPKHLRKRKRKAVKNVVNLISKEVAVQNFQPLTDKEKKVVRYCHLFLLRNLEKTRKLKEKQTSTVSQDISTRPLTPSSLAAQISALKTHRNIKTRGLTQAAHDPEIEKMAKIAVVLKEICETMETLKDVDGKPFIIKIFSNSRRKKLSPSKKHIQDFGAIKRNIEKGIYKNEDLFDKDIKQFFECSIKANASQNDLIEVIKNLQNLYNQKKGEVEKKFAEISNRKDSIQNFSSSSTSSSSLDGIALEKQPTKSLKQTSEDIIRCICGLYKDEGLMIQCSQCLVWQHAECTKADVKIENYLCEKCEPRKPNLEIPLEEFTEEGYRYFLSLLRGDLQIRQGDTVYVLRDIPIKNSDKNDSLISQEISSTTGIRTANLNLTNKHTYETIGKIDHSECDIFRVERLWKNHEGKRFIFGHHYLRPHETFHEPSRKFYSNEVVRVPLYEVVPIELVIDRCWVLDRNTFCKGRPVDCADEKHVYICELRVDKSARFFSKVKQNYITCTKSYAFRYFKEKLKVSRNYAPHDLKEISKPKKRKHEVSETCETPPPKKKFIHVRRRKLSLKTITQRRTRLENVLLKLKFRTQINSNDPIVDVSYLLTGRGIRQRKTLTSASAAAKAVI
ncbi:histone-lysine N-methyltransferase ash1 isoform X2 [Condylostylus longicornis]|nr:histone-lysine N-methyltransferase ash1 isoform X2 [Condylostylus longicornis]XP_055378612.1 histone-lysine N-methyltransferase ash1 isoform X2 [Condylostylus longicornis]